MPTLKTNKPQPPPYQDAKDPAEQARWHAWYRRILELLDGAFNWSEFNFGGSSINDIEDVNITSVGDNEVLAWDSGSAEWQNQTPAEAGLVQSLDDLSDVANSAPSDKDVLVYDGVTDNRYENRALVEADISDLQSYLLNTVEDTTPQLGGNLDVNGNKITSAANGDVDIEPNGTGNVLLGNLTFDADQTVGSGQDDFVPRYDNGDGEISLEPPADLGEYAVAGLPTASTYPSCYALATDASGGRTIVRSDGTNWKVVAVEGATVTT